jgi:acylphosphatase
MESYHHVPMPLMSHLVSQLVALSVWFTNYNVEPSTPTGKGVYHSSLTQCTLIAFVFTVFQPVREFLPPPGPLEHSRQFIVFGIDGIKASLAQPKGFRNFVKVKCQEIGLKSYVWRIPRVHGKILAKGTRDQLQALINFIYELRQHGFIETFIPEPNPQFPVLTDTFDVLRQHVVSGVYSGKELDDVVSADSDDMPRREDVSFWN